MKIIWKILKGILTVFLVLMLILVIFQRVTNSKVALGNVYIFQVVTESMAPEYQVGDIIVTKKVDPSTIKVGDDVTYLGSKSPVKDIRITHRVIEQREKDGKYYFTTQGTANEAKDPEIDEDNLYGKVIYHTVIFSFFGRLMTNNALYYGIFVLVAAICSYDIITSTFFKKDELDDEEEA